jgi:hypothetical protein
MAPTNSDDGPTVTEGTSCPFIASSPTLCFDRLGFREQALKIQDEGRNQSKSANKSTRKFRKSTYLGVSSPLGEALALRFRAATLGLFGRLGKRSPPRELVPSWEVFAFLLFITSARVRSSSVPLSFSPLIGSIVGQEILGAWNTDGTR